MSRSFYVDYHEEQPVVPGDPRQPIRLHRVGIKSKDGTDWFEVWQVKRRPYEGYPGDIKFVNIAFERIAYWRHPFPEGDPYRYHVSVLHQEIDKDESVSPQSLVRYRLKMAQIIGTKGYGI